MSKFKTVTVNQLSKVLAKQIEAGNGKLPVCISKTTFRHNLESDGCTILEVCGLRVERINILDGDGFTATTKAGIERDKKTAVLFGGSGIGFAGVLSEEAINRYIRELKWSDAATDFEKTLVAGNIRSFAAELRRMTE